MSEEWQRVAGEAYARALVAKYKAEGGRRTYDADCMAHALAAVAPMIAAAEREECAKVADARFAEHKQIAEEVAYQRPLNLVLLSVSQFRYAMAEEISDAIRARGTP